MIDELHNVLAGRADVRREFLNLLRFLGTSCGSLWWGSGP
ncbi:TniB family NTP-binding protein [Pseudarthrobacter sp. TAF60_1]